MAGPDGGLNGRLERRRQPPALLPTRPPRHPATPPRARQQITGWTKQLPKYVPWLARDSPYYNLISDESQLWQGEARGAEGAGRGARDERAAAAAAAAEVPARLPRPLGPARLPPLPTAASPNPAILSPRAELNMAWSWHEIVADYVRPTLVWMEAGGRANLSALVQQYSLNEHIGALACGGGPAAACWLSEPAGASSALEPWNRAACVPPRLHHCL